MFFVSLVDILCFEPIINWDHMRFCQKKDVFGAARGLYGENTMKELLRDTASQQNNFLLLIFFFLFNLLVSISL